MWAETIDSPPPLPAGVWGESGSLLTRTAPPIVALRKFGLCSYFIRLIGAALTRRYSPSPRDSVYSYTAVAACACAACACVSFQDSNPLPPQSPAPPPPPFLLLSSVSLALSLSFPFPLPPLPLLPALHAPAAPSRLPSAVG